MTSSLKILLVEDDDNLRGSLVSVIQRKYNVTQAANGKQAKESLTLDNYDLVISDIQMPFFNGLELLEWIRSNKKETKVFLCTRFAHILETKSTAELGADDFLTKPFSSMELFEKIDRLTKLNFPNLPPETEQQDLDLDFCKVPIEDFISEKNTELGIYIRISNSKYIKIAHKGGRIEEERVKNFKEKGVHFLYIKKVDFDKLVGFTIFLNKTIQQSKMPISCEKKMRFLKYTGELVLEHIFSIGIDQKALNESNNFLNTTIATISQDSNILELLESFNSHTDYLYVHSIAVAMFSYLIAKEIGYTNVPILFKIALGGLLHDIGKKQISKSILNKPRHKMSTEEIAEYESHIIKGKEILESMGNIPNEVITIVFEHHENNLGQGFPRKLEKRKINPLSQIIIAANIFTSYIIKRDEDSVVLNPAQALQKMIIYKIDYLNEQVFTGLKNIINNQIV